MLLLGDVSPSKASRESFRAKDVDALFSDAVSIFENRDFIFVNLECALTESDVPIKKIGPPLKGPIETAEVLKKVGVDLCGLSNNHIFDLGKRGVADTLKALDDAGLAYTGFGDNYEDSRKNYVFEKNGEKFAIIAVSEHEYCYALDDRMGARPFDEIHTLEDIRAAKAEGARVIVIYHGGKEFCRYPSPRHRKVCQGMVRAGAELILSQHSHCVGSYEEYEGATIVYGQGNFHFVLHQSTYCPDMDMWTEELAVEYDTDTKKVTYIPLRGSLTDASIMLAPDGEAILKRFEERSQILKDKKAWREEWHKFCYGYANPKKYLWTLENAVREYHEAQEDPNYPERMFPHYLTCEAHTDVWREMFPSSNEFNEKD